MNVGDVVVDTVNRGLGRYWRQDFEGRMYPAGNLNKDIGYVLGSFTIFGIGLELIGRGNASMTTAAAIVSLTALLCGNVSDHIASEGGANNG